MHFTAEGPLDDGTHAVVTWTDGTLEGPAAPLLEGRAVGAYCRGAFAPLAQPGPSYEPGWAEAWQAVATMQLVWPQATITLGDEDGWTPDPTELPANVIA